MADLLYNISSYFHKEVLIMNKILRGIAAAAMSALMLTGAAAVPAFATESGFEEAGGIGITVSAAAI
jgi:hypothetical protein